jgi:hypothetical protein
MFFECEKKIWVSVQQLVRLNFKIEKKLETRQKIQTFERIKRITLNEEYKIKASAL